MVTFAPHAVILLAEECPAGAKVTPTPSPDGQTTEGQAKLAETRALLVRCPFQVQRSMEGQAG